MAASKGIAGALAGLFAWMMPGGAQAAPNRDRAFRGRYDSAQTNDNNRKHWGQADGLSADAAASPSVRKILRERARYESANNSYMSGAIGTRTNDIVGKGPRLQLTGQAGSTQIENDWADWMKRVGLAAKLRTLVTAWATDGEGFGLKTFNPAIEHAVKLDLRLIECDQIASSWQDAGAVDGVTFDAYGNPVRYSVMKEHPGGVNIASIVGEYLSIEARDVVHLFTVLRAGQHRGIPLVTPSLQLYPQMRRYTLAVLGAAEMAASYAGVVKTDSPAGDYAESADVETIQLARNALVYMPQGWDMRQIEATQPTANYPDFKRENLSEAARCLNMPYNVAAADSSRHNYASGRLDFQAYGIAIDIDRDLVGTAVLDPLFSAWVREYELATGRRINPAHEWYWPAREHVDPVKEATATQIELLCGTTSLRAEYAKQGKDWEAEIRQIAAERKLCRELEVTLDQAAPAPVAPDPQPEAQNA